MSGEWSQRALLHFTDPLNGVLEKGTVSAPAGTHLNAKMTNLRTRVLIERAISGHNREKSGQSCKVRIIYFAVVKEFNLERVSSKNK